tara:strand:+ start:497 stop:820 length:324 start_codon:yes stop_codon:yes gene_type:complete
MKFIVSHEDNTVIVTVHLPKLMRDKKTGLESNTFVVREKHIRSYLAENKIPVGKCVQVGNGDNMGNTLTYIWKFAPVSQKKLDTNPQPVVSSNRAKRSKKILKAKDD